jgi:hypothetical protein
MTEVNQSEIKKQKFLEMFKRTFGNIFRAAEAAGISRKTYYNWCKEDSEFAEQAQEIIEASGDFVEYKLMELINRRDTTAIIFFCKTRLKERGYIERSEITGKNGEAIELSDAKSKLLHGLVSDATGDGTDQAD